MIRSLAHRIKMGGKIEQKLLKEVAVQVVWSTVLYCSLGMCTRPSELKYICSVCTYKCIYIYFIHIHRRKCVQNPILAMVTQKALMDKQLILNHLRSHIQASGAGRLQDLGDEKWRVENPLQ